MVVIVVHAGSSTLSTLPDADACHAGVVAACRNGFAALKSGKTAVDAVEIAVMDMENDPRFNAGYGSTLTIDGHVECDALIIDGKTMRAGAVAAVNKFANPVSVSRLVMEKSEHCLLVGEGAHGFGRQHDIPLIDPKSLIHETSVESLAKYKNQVLTKSEMNIKTGDADKEHDTVGAVALDKFGNVAAATSTGGLLGQLRGRVGDSPCIGAGGWAENSTVAVSTTGHGESIMKVCLAKHIATLVSNGVPVQEATQQALEYMANKVNGFGGAIAVDSNGNIGLHCSTPSMIYAYVNEDIVFYGTKINDQMSVPL